MHKIDLLFLIIAVCFKVINPGGAGMEAMLEEKDSTCNLMNYFELPGLVIMPYKLRNMEQHPGL